MLDFSDLVLLAKLVAVDVEALFRVGAFFAALDSFSIEREAKRANVSPKWENMPSAAKAQAM